MRFFIYLLMLGTLAMATQIDQIEIKGKNITIIFEEDNRLPIFNMQLIFKNSGSLSDDTKIGLAKLSSKMLNEGTLSLDSNGFAKELESKAIGINTSIGKETLVIDVNSLKEQNDDALKYLKMLLDEPNLTQKSLNKVKTTILGELSKKESDFDYIASIELKKLLFNDTVFAKPSLGTPQSIEEITLKDTEEKIKNSLVLSKLIIAIGGDINLNELKPKLIALLKELPLGSDEQCKKFIPSADAKENIIKKDTQQAYIYFGSPYNTDINSKDYYKAKVATFILGSGGFGSRLMEEIRVKKGLAYSAYARLDTSKSATFLSGYLQTKLDSADDAKKSVKKVLENFVKNGVNASELEQTKKFMLGSEPLRVETMNQRLSRSFMEYYNDQESDYAKKELELIQKLTLQELNEYIKTHREILNLSFAIVTK